MKNNESKQKTIELKVPNVGDTPIELVEWHFRENDFFSAGDELCDLVTDKASFSLEAPQDGKLLKIFAPAKHNVSVGQIVAQVQIEG